MGPPPAPAKGKGAALTLNKQLKASNTLVATPALHSAAGLPTLQLVPDSTEGGRPLMNWPREKLDEHSNCRHCGKRLLSRNISNLAKHL